jgi:hypothetical protein
MITLSIIGSGRIVEEHIKAAKLNNIKVKYIFSSRLRSKNCARLANKYKIENIDTFDKFMFLSIKSKSYYLIAGRISKNSYYLKKCIATKKKILIEKPIFLKSENFKNFLFANDQIFVGYNRIFYKNIRYIKESISKLKNLTVNCYLPELNKTRILSNSSHVISILLYLFKNIRLIYKDTKSKSIFLRYNLPNKNVANLFINFKAILNFKIEIISEDFLISLQSIEELKVYNKLKKKSYKNNNIYKLQSSHSINEYDLNNIKPGIFYQMQEFKKFCQGKKIINNLKFAEQIINICEKIIK